MVDPTRHRLALIYPVALALTLATLSSCDAKRGPPNVVLIIADDLGFSDLGSYGGEIRTPNLDSLAREGLRFSQFYNTGRCWPTRAALLTGYYAQHVDRDGWEPANHKGTRPAWARLLPRRLRPLGYRSYHSGKWHLDGGPLRDGFSRAYVVNDYEHLGSNDHLLDGKKLEPAASDSGYYSAVAIADHAIESIRHHHEVRPKAPFFSYVAFTSPHFPLRALPEDITKAKGRYDQGWDEVRSARWARMRDIIRIPGILSSLEPDIGSPNPPALGPELAALEPLHETPWDQLTVAQRSLQSAKMEIHAAMIERMDHEIGRILRALDAIGERDNTVVMFLSDNGASAELLGGELHHHDATPGSAATFLTLGPSWARAANTPFRRHKSWVHEGGIATPFLVRWPGGIMARGQTRQTAAHVVDLAPTILELAGGTWQTLNFAGEAPKPPGRSLVRSFRTDPPDESRTIWWSHRGHRALRVGKWKLVAAYEKPWELYDLSADRTEMADLAHSDTARVKEMERIWTRMANEMKTSSANPP